MKGSEVKSSISGLSYKVFVLSALLMLNSCNNEDTVQTQNVESYTPKKVEVSDSQNSNNNNEEEEEKKEEEKKEDKKEDEKESKIKKDYMHQQSGMNDNQNNNSEEIKNENKLQIKENDNDSNIINNQSIIDGNLINEQPNYSLDNEDEMLMGNLKFKLSWDDNFKSYKLILSKEKGEKLDINDYTISVTYKKDEGSQLQVIAKFQDCGLKYVTFGENESRSLSDFCSKNNTINKKVISFGIANWGNKEKVDVRLTVKYKEQKISFDMSFYTVIEDFATLSPDKILLQVKRNENNENQLDLGFLSKDKKCKIVNNKVFFKYICYCENEAINDGIKLLRYTKVNRSPVFININNYDLSNFTKLKFLKIYELKESDFVKISIIQDNNPNKLDCDKISFFAYEKNEKGEEINVVELGSWLPKSCEWVVKE